MSDADPIVVRGDLGWSNDARTASSYDVYGPDGRWGERPYRGDPPKTQGHKLADALNEAGAHEGARFVVVAVNRFGDDGLLDAVEQFVAERTESHATDEPRRTVGGYPSSGRPASDLKPPPSRPGLGQ